MKFFFFLFTILIFSSCFFTRSSDKSYQKIIQKTHKGFSIVRDEVINIPARYLRYQNIDPMLPTLFFIHGAPGSSSSFIDYIQNETLREKYSIIVIDRPGYGYTNYGKYTTLEDQVKLITHLIEKLDPKNNVYLIGHSYGATLAGLLAIDPPKSVVASIMLAPAIDPENEKYFWFSYLGKWKITRWLAPNALKIATDEKFNHAEELRKFIPKWSEIDLPILHVHGDRDQVVPYINMEFSEKNINSNSLNKMTLKGKGHLFPVKEKTFTVGIIDEYVQLVERTKGKELKDKIK